MMTNGRIDLGIGLYKEWKLMKYLLTGNGVNIQFDKNNYTTQQIVLRILQNCDRDDFPRHIIVDNPCILKNYLGKLYLEARELIAGNYDYFLLGTL